MTCFRCVLVVIVPFDRSNEQVEIITERQVEVVEDNVVRVGPKSITTTLRASAKCVLNTVSKLLLSYSNSESNS